MSYDTDHGSVGQSARRLRDRNRNPGNLYCRSWYAGSDCGKGSETDPEIGADHTGGHAGDAVGNQLVARGNSSGIQSCDSNTDRRLASAVVSARGAMEAEPFGSTLLLFRVRADGSVGYHLCADPKR